MGYTIESELLYSDCGCQVIRFSHNVADLAPKLTRMGFHLLVAIIQAFHKNIVYDFEKLNSLKFKEQKIVIPRKIISKRNVSDISKDLLYLKHFAFVFSRLIPGRSSAEITQLISEIDCKHGRVTVTIPSDTIPWLIYCGEQVGFCLIETDVLFELPNYPEQLLYLYLLSRHDNNREQSLISIPVSDINGILGVKSTRPIGSINQKYIKDFHYHLKSLGSKYRVNIKKHKPEGYTNKTGARPIDRYDCLIMNTMKCKGGETTMLEEVVDKLIPILAKYGTPRREVGYDRLIKAVENTGKSEEFYFKMSKISRQNEKKQNYYWLANTATKILREDFKIDLDKI